ncbi:MAG: hypothetical protein ACE5GB_04090 [Acidimicrobiales bacterium]
MFDLALSHPDPAVGTRLAEHAAPYAVEAGRAGLRATLLTPSGLVELRS